MVAPHDARLRSAGLRSSHMATDIRLKEALPEITEAVVETYTDCSKSSHLGHKPLPSRDAIVDILSDMMEILYPGYIRRQNLHMGNVEYHVGDLIDGLHDKFTQQICRALRHDYGQETPNEDFEGKAQQKAVDMLRRLPELRMVLEQDVEAAYVGDPAARGYTEI